MTPFLGACLLTPSRQNASQVSHPISPRSSAVLLLLCAYLCVSAGNGRPPNSSPPVATPLAFQQARVFTGSVEGETEIRGGQIFVRLRLHIAAVEEIRVAVVIAEESLVERFKRRRRDKHRVHPDGARKDGHVIHDAPAHQLFLDRLWRVLRQQARKALGANFHGGEFRDPLSPFDALIDPAEYILAKKKEHTHFGVSAGQQALFQIVRLRPLIGNQARKHERGFGTFQQGGRRDALVEWMEDERRPILNRLPQYGYGR